MAHSDVAVQARTSVDCARVGSLTTYARFPGSQHTCSVSVRARADDTVEVELAVDALSARQLIARPVASLLVAPVGCEPVLLHGSARRLPGHSQRGTLVFHLEVAAVRVGNGCVLVDEAAYCAAAPDPLRHDAPAVLAHLNEGHADALAACLRAGGARRRLRPCHPAGRRWPDRHRHRRRGRRHRAAGRSVARLADLPISLNCLLSPRCRCRCAHAPADPRAVRDERR